MPPKRRNWLADIVGVCAVIGPPLSFVMAVATDRATTAIRLENHEERIRNNSGEAQIIRRDLADIRENVQYIRGQLERMNASRVPAGRP